MAFASSSFSRDRRRWFRLFLSGCLLIPGVALAGCANRQPLPEERRTRGKFGHKGD